MSPRSLLIALIAPALVSGFAACILNTHGFPDTSSGGAGGATTTSASTTTSSLLTTSSSTSSSISGCSMSTAPGDADCPLDCNSCNVTDKSCYINCTGTVCKNITMSCPLNWQCFVNCAGPGSCEAMQLHCPDQYTCAVSCSGPTSCKGAEVVCGGGLCTLTCGSGTAALDSCDGAKLTCGTGQCKANCTPSESNKPAVTCGSACACAQCP
jgi:hypothetical protein